jgi:4-oxalocrotonate tautomerase family enzyme
MVFPKGLQIFILSREQKEKLIQGPTQLLVDVLRKNPATTVVVIEEVETDNGFG